MVMNGIISINPRHMNGRASTAAMEIFIIIIANILVMFAWLSINIHLMEIITRTKCHRI